ncbi:MAG: hypothetical protein KDD40_04665 [Bdellovibrionales bacterium]|nr:hypothetical protein [Bdellovibrionales bacterium]
MQFKVFFILFISMTGLISCNSDDKKANFEPRTVHIDDRFEVSKPQLVRLSNNEVQPAGKLTTKVLPFSLYDKLELQLSNVHKWQLTTTCKDHKDVNKIQLNIQNQSQVLLFEVLPYPFLFNDKNVDILCQIDLVAYKKTPASTHSFKISNLRIKDVKQTTLQIYNLQTQREVENGEYLHLEDIKNALPRLSTDSNYDEIAFRCAGIELFKQNIYQLDFARLDWTNWLKIQHQARWSYIHCEFWLFYKKRITAWSPTFYLYSSKPLLIGPQIVKSPKKIPLSFNFRNKSSNTLYVKINKEQFRQAFRILNGFNLASTHVQNLQENIDKSWLRANGLESLYISPNNSKHIYSTLEDWYYEIKPYTTATFHLGIKRNPDCKDIYIHTTNLQKIRPLEFTILTDLSPMGESNPFTYKEFPEMKNIFRQKSYTRNNQNQNVHFKLDSNLGISIMPFRGTIDKEIRGKMRKNFVGHFNCVQEKL